MEIYVPVRIATLVLIGISMIAGILDLVKMVDSQTKNITAIVSLAIVVVILFIGGYGSFKNERSYLTTFSLLLIITIIISFSSAASIYLSIGFNILLVILALTQAELLRRGY